MSFVESRLFGRICYGYRRDKQGLVEIVPEEAEVVRTVFNLYKAGNSLEAIQNYLFSQGIRIDCMVFCMRLTQDCAAI